MEKASQRTQCGERYQGRPQRKASARRRIRHPSGDGDCIAWRRLAN